MATVEQALARTLKDKGSLRLPVSVSSFYGDTEASAVEATERRVERIASYAGKPVEIETETADGRVVALVARTC